MNTAMVVVTNVKSLPDISRIEPFNGTHYKRWQEKVMFTLDVTDYAFAIMILNQRKKKNCKIRKMLTKFVNTSFSAHLVMHCLMFTALIKLQLSKKYILENVGT